MQDLWKDGSDRVDAAGLRGQGANGEGSSDYRWKNQHMTKIGRKMNRSSVTIKHVAEVILHMIGLLHCGIYQGLVAVRSQRDP